MTASSSLEKKEVIFHKVTVSEAKQSKAYWEMMGYRHIRLGKFQLLGCAKILMFLNEIPALKENSPQINFLLKTLVRYFLSTWLISSHDQFKKFTPELVKHELNKMLKKIKTESVRFGLKDEMLTKLYHDMTQLRQRWEKDIVNPSLTQHFIKEVASTDEIEKEMTRLDRIINDCEEKSKEYINSHHLKKAQRQQNMIAGIKKTISELKSNLSQNSDEKFKEMVNKINSDKCKWSELDYADPVFLYDITKAIRQELITTNDYITLQFLHAASGHFQSTITTHSYADAKTFNIESFFGYMKLKNLKKKFHQSLESIASNQRCYFTLDLDHEHALFFLMHMIMNVQYCDREPYRTIFIDASLKYVGNLILKHPEKSFKKLENALNDSKKNKIISSETTNLLEECIFAHEDQQFSANIKI